MSDVKIKIDEVIEEFDTIVKSLNLAAKEEETKKLEAASTDPDFWNDQAAARETMQKLGDIKKEIEEIEGIAEEIEIVKELDDQAEVDKLAKRLAKLKLKTYLSGKYDIKNAIVAIHAGQGGTEAMDWVSMLLRMYMRFCERKGWEMEVVDQTAGEEAGIKSITFRVVGAYVYGYLKGEAGTHRLVRQSPFNADKLRQTSFALVEVLPEFEEVDLPDIEIKEDDLEWDFFRASGQGGQNVQKVSSAVRLRHKPTGLVVTAQTERYQEQNRKYALNLLRAKLWARHQEEQRKEKEKVSGEYTPATWGTQIRSYVLHPYKMVKDLRTAVETSNPDAVLDGDLDEFVEAELKL
ncbi:peptide chain release factor 2 [Candidatus Woesebacteria bacterium RIFCSPHIGHO2_01_FULL_44_10]|uniref:Peptide chain release factor 2 n=1 Tax=Candidatus Woesebacteria bacterium RIFCSPLOWO2_01_FULL_44_14 TaxID=1802525 RepID=A0A1F8C3T2_9BACT|nr:MAG: peptide chain release factor 2 [Candidatus Woesebacteria bacterium RIFCSPHIGHO2_01_FULL_44_10]OGM54951.1 MAG: peptide chain release factor 2 [Candidatus Woesebacteria bacterium RIFCSPHIGHO2_12_FULL_44_11]OGM70338.1 MAG: peptide chain release factor 2 [Candidatus Woesebacteria bacterium RIFCSPLOWO2_01_FULL_44_14]